MFRNIDYRALVVLSEKILYMLQDKEEREPVLCPGLFYGVKKMQRLLSPFSSSEKKTT